MKAKTDDEKKTYLRIYGWTFRNGYYYRNNFSGGHTLDIAYRAQKFGA